MFTFSKGISTSILSFFGIKIPEKKNALSRDSGEFRCRMCEDTRLLVEGTTAELCYCSRPVVIRDYPEMNRVADILPENDVRVIAARDDFIVGDCTISTGNILIEKMACPEYAKQVEISAWRYSQSLDLVPENLTPNQWTPLPTARSLK